MAMDGSVSHGDADTLAENFDPDFKEYVLKEQLKWSLYKQNSSDLWVFWSEPSLSLDNCADIDLNVCAIPKVRDNIRRALQKLVQSHSWIYPGLVQFWAATKTLEGRTLLTTRYEPFALAGSFGPSDRVRLCNYRMEMCRKYNNCFYADAESGEEQLGLPGRVFRNQFPESIPRVEYYTTKEYPQRNLALRSDIWGSWAVPVFEHSSQICVGVLEMVSLFYLPPIRHYEFFPRRICDVFQEHGLRCLRFDGQQACEVEPTKKEKRIKGLTQAFKELKTALRLVCLSHKLPLAMSWVPCSDCNGLRRCKVYSAGVEFCLPRDFFLREFLKVSKCGHLRKGLVAERARSSLNMLYCSDITQLSLDEYPLVHYARRCNLSGWFTICLLCEHTGNYIYVLEFFLSARNKNDENIVATLSDILGTMEEKFKTFRFASGKVLGELTSVEVIYFQNNQKNHYEEWIQATREFSMSSIPSSVQSSASVAYRGPGFQDVNMGTIKAKYDLNSNPFSNFDPSFDSDSDPSFEQSSTSVANTRPGFQNANVVIIIAEYASMEEVFELSLPCRLVELQQEVTRRLMLEVGTYDAIYEDEEDGPVLINCDEDLQTYVDDSMSQGDTPRVVLVEQKEPATNLNPTN